MTTLREAALMALEALLWHYEQGHSNTETGFRLKIDQRAIRQLRAALAEQTVPSDCPDSHQPVAWMYEGEKDFDGRKWSFSWEFTDSRRLAEWKSGTQKKPIPLYTHPPQQKAAPFSPDSISTAQTAWNMGYKAAKAEMAEQEPFGYFMPEPFGWVICAADDEGAIALYENPQCTPLTDEDIEKLMKDTWGSARIAPQSVPAFARAIERAHGIGGEV